MKDSLEIEQETLFLDYYLFVLLDSLSNKQYRRIYLIIGILAVLSTILGISKSPGWQRILFGLIISLVLPLFIILFVSFLSAIFFYFINGHHLVSIFVIDEFGVRKRRTQAEKQFRWLEFSDWTETSNKFLVYRYKNVPFFITKKAMQEKDQKRLRSFFSENIKQKKKGSQVSL